MKTMTARQIFGLIADRYKGESDDFRITIGAHRDYDWSPVPVYEAFLSESLGNVRKLAEDGFYDYDYSIEPKAACQGARGEEAAKDASE